MPTAQTALQPDVVVVADDEASQPRLTRPPLLVVEVISPSSRSLDLGAKRLAYAQAGVPQYWVVDPEPPIELVVLEPQGPTYVEMSRARGAVPLAAQQPFPVTVVPENLLEV